jgi:hypothetical protein
MEFEGELQAVADRVSLYSGFDYRQVWHEWRTFSLRG